MGFTHTYAPGKSVYVRALREGERTILSADILRVRGTTPSHIVPTEVRMSCVLNLLFPHFHQHISHCSSFIVLRLIHQSKHQEHHHFNYISIHFFLLPFDSLANQKKKIILFSIFPPRIYQFYDLQLLFQQQITCEEQGVDLKNTRYFSLTFTIPLISSPLT